MTGFNNQIHFFTESETSFTIKPNPRIQLMVVSDVLALSLSVSGSGGWQSGTGGRAAGKTRSEKVTLPARVRSVLTGCKALTPVSHTTLTHSG